MASHETAEWVRVSEAARAIYRSTLVWNVTLPYGSRQKIQRDGAERRLRTTPDMVWRRNGRGGARPAPLLALLILALCMGCFGPSAGAAATSTRHATDRRSTTSAQSAIIVARELQSRGIPGLAVAVALHGRIVWSAAVGYADVEQHVLARPDTLFRIGSTSKSLTAVALVKLHQENRLDLDAPVQRYVPSFPDKGAPISARLLAGHLSGIRHYKLEETLSRPGQSAPVDRHYDSVDDALSIFEDDPLVGPPGSKFSYSSFGYNLLGAVIENAAGKDYLAYMRDDVLLPLGLHDTIPDQNSDIVERRARFYTYTVGANQWAPGRPHALANAGYVDDSYKWASGGFLSSVDDLARFGSALLTPGTFLNSESLSLLFTSQKTSAGVETNYGMGFHIGRSVKGQRICEHGGGVVGGTVVFVIYPDDGLVVAIAVNLTSAPITTSDAQRFADIFLR